MYIDNLAKPDLESMSFEQIFSLYDDNFDIVKKAVQVLGDKTIPEIVDHLGTGEIVLTNAYQIGKNQLEVYLNGVRQWVGQDYTEMTANSFQFNFDIN